MIENFKINLKEIDKINLINQDDKNYRIKNLEFFNQSVVSFICLFLILSIGVSHGALDNYKANKILKIYKMDSKLVFYLSYIF